MEGSTPQTYTIADVLKWNDDRELELNPKFQRGPVWSAQARTYLIDSILRGYPIPKLLFRTSIDRDSRRTVRDVVDGQQRLRTIIDFASDRLRLGTKAAEFAGSSYSDLPDELKDKYLAYKLTCEQLINASDEDVLEVFVRINSYTVPVSEAELRNARFDSNLSDMVKRISQNTSIWDIGVLSARDRIRMVDQSTIAELFAFADRGVTDGAEQDITRYYSNTKTKAIEELPPEDLIVSLLEEAEDLLAPFAGEPIVQRPHFLMCCAALLYRQGKLPSAKLELPPSAPKWADLETAQQGIGMLNAALASDFDGDRFDSWRDARTTTQRIRSRQIRFDYFVAALAGSLTSR